VDILLNRNALKRKGKWWIGIKGLILVNAHEKGTKKMAVR
jgi:hypothetical protein